MVGPTMFAVNFSSTHGLVCHFLTLPRFYKTLLEAAAHSTCTQVARVHLSFTYLVGVFLPSWRPVSQTRKKIKRNEEGLVQMLIWDDVVPECRGRYVSVKLQDSPNGSTQKGPGDRGRSRNSHITSYDDYPPLETDEDDDDTEDPSSSPLSSSQSSIPSVSSYPSPRHTYEDYQIHFGTYVTLPRPGLFDESVSGHLACIGCSDGIARSQIIDGPDGARGVRRPVLLGRCEGISEFSYMDCWSGVLGVAELVGGRLCLRTLTL